MSQLKLLNFYKLLSYIATKLVGAFIPLIVIEATGKLYIGALSLILMFVVRMSFNFLFRNVYQKYPQVILLLRIVTVLAYSVSIILIESSLWVGVVGCIFFYGLDDSFRAIPSETLFNYASQEKTEGKSPLGFSRLMEQLGGLVALVVGGVMLDIDKTLITIISIVIYSISVVPLFIYFIKSRHQKTFNKDAVSNAQLKYEKNPELSKNAKEFSKKVLWSYAITYFIFCFQDVLGNALNIHIFLKSGGSFGAAGYLNAVYNGLYGVGCYIFSAIDSKKETTPLIVMSCLGCAGSVLSIILINNIVCWYIAMAIAGTLYGFICTFMLARMLPKCRIMGESNNALFYRENVSNASVIICMLLGFGSMIPVLIGVVATMIISAVNIPYNEEKTRKVLIKYLRNHERVMSTGNNNSKRKEIYDQNPIIDLSGTDKVSETSKKSVRKSTRKKENNNERN